MTNILIEKLQAKSRRASRASSRGVVRDPPRDDVETPPSSESDETEDTEPTQEGDHTTDSMATNATEGIGKEEGVGTLDAVEGTIGPPEPAVNVDRGRNRAPSVALGIIGGDDLTVAIEIQEDETEPTAVAEPHKAGPDSGTRRRFQLYLVVVVLVLAVVTTAAVAGIIVTMRNSANPDSEPTASPTSFAGAYRDVFETIAGGDIYDPGHPSNLAAEWIMNEDPLKLLPDAPNLAQRFVLVSLYFSASQGADDAWGGCKKPAEDESADCSFWHACFPTKYHKFHGPSTRWLSDTDECEWAGITCTSSNDVESLLLCENNMVGSIPSSLSALASLVVLDLSFNGFNGTLPSELGHLYQLQGLSAQGNELAGTIPDEYWDLGSLRVLDIGNNRLTGTLNPSVGRLWRMQRLLVHDNELEGTFPAAVSELTDLRSLQGDNNTFTGTLHSELSKLTNLEVFSFSHNGFNGTIPTEVGQMRALTKVYLGHNKIEGTIPEEVYGLDLEHLFLNDMNLNGTISTAIGSLTSLRQLMLNYNSLTGTIPTELGLCTDLLLAHFHVNELTGSMPDAVCQNRKASERLQILQADCWGDPPEVECLLGECCTACCDEFGSCKVPEV